MKTLILLLLSQILVMSYAHCQTFVETITEIAARDAVALYDGSIYASNYNNGTVYKIEEDGSTTIVIEANTDGSAGIEFDDAGNMYVAMYNINSIIKVDPQGNRSVFATDVVAPIALDFDDNQNLYVSSFQGSNTVTRIDRDGAASQLGLVSQLTQISSLALDPSGDIYVTSYNTGAIYRMTPSGSVSLFTTASPNGLRFLRYDANENVFYAVDADNGILKITADGTPEVLLRSATPGVIDGPVASASMQTAIGLAVSDDGKQVYFATDTHIRRLVFADVAVDQVRPYFTNDGAVSVEEGQALSFKFEFIDPNNDPLTLTLENIPTWAAFDGTDLLTGTPGSTDAGMSFNVSANLSDGASNVTSNLNIAVTAMATPPAPAPTPAPTPTPVAPDNSSGGGSMGFGFAGLLFALVLIRRLTIGAKCETNSL